MPTLRGVESGQDKCACIRMPARVCRHQASSISRVDMGMIIRQARFCHATASIQIGSNFEWGKRDVQQRVELKMGSQSPDRPKLPPSRPSNHARDGPSRAPHRGGVPEFAGIKTIAMPIC